MLDFFQSLHNKQNGRVQSNLLASACESQSAMSLLHPDERQDLLIACLSFAPTEQTISYLRRCILTEQAALDGILNAAARRFLVLAAIDGLVAKGIIHLQSRKRNTRNPLRLQLQALHDRYARRRAEMRAVLGEIIRGLNQSDIEPLILKGAVSLMTGQPPWRHQGDIDFAIEPEQRAATVAVLRSLGFGDDPTNRVSAHHHHLQPMVREGFSASVEPHVRLIGKRGARVLDERVLRKRAVPVEREGLRYRMLRNDDQVLFSLVHHHFQNTGSIFGIVSLKGLYELCHGLSGLSEEELRDFLLTTNGNPRLKSAVELWIATGAILFASPVPALIAPGEFARKRAQAVSERILRGQIASRWRALREDISGSFAATGDHSGKQANNSRSLIVNPISESMLKRSIWVSKAKKRKISGIF